MPQRTLRGREAWSRREQERPEQTFEEALGGKLSTRDMQTAEAREVVRIMGRLAV